MTLVDFFVFLLEIILPIFIIALGIVSVLFGGFLENLKGRQNKNHKNNKNQH